MPELEAAAELRRAFVLGDVAVRADPSGRERIIEGTVFPYDTPTTVQDTPGGPTYREQIARGAAAGLDPASVMLEMIEAPAAGQLHGGAVLVGRGVAVDDQADRLRMAFRVSRSRAGDDALELAGDGVLGSMSVVFAPVASRRLEDGTVERSSIDVRRVAILERGAYQGARVEAVRAATEDAQMPDQPAAAAATTPEEDPTPAAAPTPAPAAAERPNRTRVTVDVERAQAERDAAAAVGRGAPAGGIAHPRSTFQITRAELAYGPGSGRSYFGDQWLIHKGRADQETIERVERHRALLVDVDQLIQRSIGFGQGELGRAGDVLSSEIPGAYPSEYLPGLIVNRILKQRPMGGFYQRFPIEDGRPRIYPVVSTSTTVAVQGAEGANPAASDLATTGTTVTPLFYGGETKVSRQVLDGADPSTDVMLSTDLNEAYMQASEAVIRAAVEAGSTASGVTLTAATPDAGLRALLVNHIGTVFLPAERLFLPTTLTSSWILQNDTTGRPLAPVITPMNSAGQVDVGALPIIGQVLQTPVAQSWSSTPGAGAGVGGVAVAGRASDFAIFESNLADFTYDQGAEAPSAVRIGLWAYLVVGVRRGSRKATGA